MCAEAHNLFYISFLLPLGFSIKCSIADDLRACLIRSRLAALKFSRLVAVVDFASI